MTDADQPTRSPLALRLIPNALTLLRIAAAVYFPFAPAAGLWRAALVLFAAGSDFLDGWLARRLGATSWVGAVLDGVADKALTLCVLLTYSLEGSLAWWHLGLVMLRDIAVLAIAAYLAWCRAWGEFTRVAARQPGKVTTVFVYALMVALLLAPKYAFVAVWPAAIMSLLAAIDYVIVCLSVERR